MSRDRRRLVELSLLAGILVLAALLRLPGLDRRGQWDADQGRDMLVLQSMVQDGQIPLLGPHTLAGTFHHGALYYYLFAPAAAISNADPVAVTGEFALLGIGAVAATWWLARLVAGPVAAAVAGLLAAVSPAGITGSTFIWNPNPVPLAAAVAFAGVLQARRSGRSRWWLLAALGAMAAMQLHVEGAVILVPLVAAWVIDLRRRRAAGRPTGPLLRTGAGSLLILAMGYAPLAIHELTHDFSEIRAVLGYVSGGGTGGAGLLERIMMVALRSLTWPVSGLLTDRPAASMVTLVLVIGLGAAAYVLAPRQSRAPADDPGRWPPGWLLGTIAWSVAALAVLAPSLAVIVPGLPNDHYHAFLDPIVLALVGAGTARLATAAVSSRRAATGQADAVSTDTPPRDGAPAASAGGAARGLAYAGPIAAVAATVILAAIAVGGWPPAVSPDGGWALADAAAAHTIDRIAAVRQPGEPAILVGLPTFKSDDAMRFPLERRGLDLRPAVATPVPGDPVAGALPTGVVTVVCDPLFDEATGAACGGLAEARWLADAYPPGQMVLVERFRAGPSRVISIYAPSRLASTGIGPGSAR